MIEDMALGCWVENNVDLSESDNEEEFFDPNEPNEGNNEDVLQEDERSHMSRDAIPWDFGTAVGEEIDRILISNGMLLINARTDRSQDMSNEPEWPQL